MTTITMSCKRDVYKIFETIEINGEKFVIIKIEHSFNDLLHLEPLHSFIAKTHTMHIDKFNMSIAEYIEEIAKNFHVNTGETP